MKQQLHSGSNSLNVHIEAIHLSVYGQELCDTQFKGIYKIIDMKLESHFEAN